MFLCLIRHRICVMKIALLAYLLENAYQIVIFCNIEKVMIIIIVQVVLVNVVKDVEIIKAPAIYVMIIYVFLVH